jgi:hypothetical protein
MKKKIGKNSGKSKSQFFPYGKRRMKDGKELAPKSIRKKHKFLNECTEEELKKAEVV